NGWGSLVPTSVLLRGLPLYEDDQYPNGWRHSALLELTKRIYFRDPRTKSSKLTEAQWRWLAIRAFNKVPSNANNYDSHLPQRVVDLYMDFLEAAIAHGTV